MSLEIDIFNKLLKMRKENDHVKENTWSCLMTNRVVYADHLTQI